MISPDTVVLLGLGAIVGLFVLLLAAFCAVYGTLRLALALVRAIPGRPRLPAVPRLERRLRAAGAMATGPSPSSAEHWTARYLP